MGWGGGAMMMIFWLVAVALVVWGAWAFAQRRGIGLQAGANRAEALLHERYARGEIDEATHRHMLEELRR